MKEKTAGSMKHEAYKSQSRAAAVVVDVMGGNGRGPAGSAPCLCTPVIEIAHTPRLGRGGVSPASLAFDHLFEDRPGWPDERAYSHQSLQPLHGTLPRLLTVNGVSVSSSLYRSERRADTTQHCRLGQF